MRTESLLKEIWIIQSEFAGFLLHTLDIVDQLPTSKLKLGIGDLVTEPRLQLLGGFNECEAKT